MRNSRATLASNRSKEQRLREARSPEIEKYDLDVIALIVNAYQEWHLGEKAEKTILHHL